MLKQDDLVFLEDDKYLIRMLDVLSKNDYRLISYILLRSRELDVYTRSMCFNQEFYNFNTTNRIFNSTGIYNIECPCELNLDKLRPNITDYKIHFTGSLKMLYFFRTTLLKDSRYSFTIISFIETDDYPLRLTELLNYNVSFYPDVLSDILLNHTHLIQFKYNLTKERTGNFDLENLVNFLSVLNNGDECGDLLFNKYPELHLVFPHTYRLFNLNYDYFRILNNYFNQIYIDIDLDVKQFYRLLLMAKSQTIADFGKDDLQYLIYKLSEYGVKFKLTEQNYNLNSVEQLLMMID